MTGTHEETIGAWTVSESLEMFFKNSGVFNNVNGSESFLL
jgi:hypothetical protein